MFPQKNDFDDEMVVRFKHRHDARTLKPGIKLKSDNKAIFCQNFAKLYKINRINITDETTINYFFRYSFEYYKKKYSGFRQIIYMKKPLMF